MPGRRRGDRASGALRARAQGRKPRALRFQATLWHAVERVVAWASFRHTGPQRERGGGSRRVSRRRQPVGCASDARAQRGPRRDYYAFKPAVRASGAT